MRRRRRCAYWPHAVLDPHRARSRGPHRHWSSPANPAPPRPILPSRQPPSALSATVAELARAARSGHGYPGGTLGPRGGSDPSHFARPGGGAGPRLLLLGRRLAGAPLDALRFGHWRVAEEFPGLLPRWSAAERVRFFTAWARPNARARDWLLEKPVAPGRRPGLRANACSTPGWACCRSLRPPASICSTPGASVGGRVASSAGGGARSGP